MLLVPNLDLLTPAFNPVLQFLSDVLISFEVTPSLWLQYTAR